MKKKTNKWNTMIAEPADDQHTLNDWQCRCCGGTDYSVTGNYPSTMFGGTTPDGQPYSRVDRQAVRCGDCGQNAVRIIYTK